MTDILFDEDKRADASGYDEALHVLNRYLGGCEKTEAEDLTMLALMWDAHKCTCGTCEGCWLFTSHRGAMGPLSFWVHGDHVEQYSSERESIWRAHDAVLAA